MAVALVEDRFRGPAYFVELALESVEHALVNR
jgi:hypothetical protein